MHDIDFDKDLDVVVNECLPELVKIVKEGKARFIGITSYNLEVLKECIKRAPCVDVINIFHISLNSLHNFRHFHF